MRSRSRREPNYEDIYFLLRQIGDHVEGEMENPAICRTAQALESELAPVLTSTSIRFDEAIREARHYISDSVWRRLQGPACSATHLAPLERLCASDRLERLTIATLCHDTHIETHLAEKLFEFTDGFGPVENMLRYWHPERLDSELGAPLLLKLHGSVDWFLVRPEGGSEYESRVGIPIHGKYDIGHDPEGRRLVNLSNRPLILVGTFNKILDYHGEVFYDLMRAFRLSLEQSESLVVCGYGFGDKGINYIINRWLYSGNHRVMTLIHPQPDRLRRGARGAIANNWEEWEMGNRLRVIGKSWEDLSPDDLVDACTS